MKGSAQRSAIEFLAQRSITSMKRVQNGLESLGVRHANVGHQNLYERAFIIRTIINISSIQQTGAHYTSIHPERLCYATCPEDSKTIENDTGGQLVE